MKDLLDILKSPKVRWKPENREFLDAGAWSRLVAHLEKIVPEHLDFAPIRDPALRALIVNDDSKHVPLFASAMEKMKNNWTTLQVAHFRARHDDKGVLPFLRLAVDKAPADDRIRLASGMARLGDAGRIELVRAGLDSPRLSDRVDAIRGLAMQGDGLPLERALYDNGVLWRKPELLAAIGEVATRRDDAVATTTLVYVWKTGGAEASAKARAELARRLGEERLDAADEVFDIFFGARESIRYRQWKAGLDVLAAFDERDEFDRRILGPWWWTAVRTAWEFGDRDRARRELDRLAQTTAEAGFVADLVARVRPRLETKPLPEKDTWNFEAKGLGVASTYKPGKIMIAEFEIVNRSESFVTGGYFPNALQLGLAFVDAAGKTTLATTPRYLPIRGLEPGESVRMTILAKLPTKKAVYTPKLFVMDERNLGRAVELFAGAPFDVR